jgi:hypothetical protein
MGRREITPVELLAQLLEQLLETVAVLSSPAETHSRGSQIGTSPSTNLRSNPQTRFRCGSSDSQMQVCSTTPQSNAC